MSRDTDRMAQLLTELRAYLASRVRDDPANFEAKAAHVEELLRQLDKAMGLPEDEIARIERETEAAIDKQLADPSARWRR